MRNTQHPTTNIQHPLATCVGHHWMFNVGCWLLDVPKFLLRFAIRAYQLTISPMLAFLCGPAAGCRFTPTCSQYAMDALREHGAMAGGWLAAKRICRCHPWGGCGHDPVPEQEFRNPNSAFRT